MEAHAVIHTGDKPFQCNLCEKRFNNKANLNKHKLIHGNKRPFVCNICGQAYRQSYDLKRHMSTHSDDKSFSCAQCGKCFARKSYLQRHVLTHVSDKKFSCMLCDRKFLQRGHLNFHMKNHDGKKGAHMNDKEEKDVVGKLESKIVDFLTTSTTSATTFATEQLVQHPVVPQHLKAKTLTLSTNEIVQYDNENNMTSSTGGIQESTLNYNDQVDQSAIVDFNKSTSSSRDCIYEETSQPPPAPQQNGETNNTSNHCLNTPSICDELHKEHSHSFLSAVEKESANDDLFL